MKVVILCESDVVEICVFVMLDMIKKLIGFGVFVVVEKDVGK